MTVALAVFDIAGTTVQDSDFVARAFITAFRQKGLYVTAEEVNPVMGYLKPLAIEMVLEKLDIHFDKTLIGEMHGHFVKEMKSFYSDSDEVNAMPHTEAVFTKLKQEGVRIALNTGFSKEIADVIVERFQWLKNHLVDDYIASDEVEKGRPYPNMMHELMKRSGGIRPDMVAKIGDTVVDIAEGKSAGCKHIIAVTTGTVTRQALAVHRPTHIVDDILEVAAILA